MSRGQAEQRGSGAGGQRSAGGEEKRRRGRWKEIPFGYTFLAAIALHILIGAVLKMNPLIAASPVPPPSNSPVTVRFVESPPEAKSISSTPDTDKVSAGNFKAGPLKPAPAGNRVADRPPTRRQPERPAPARNEPEQSTREVPGPSIQAPAGIEPETDGQLREGDSKQEIPLGKSLENLDRYISQGTGSQDGGSGGTGGDGSIPGDPGSGVFFDTRGFDLGPWGNRVVAIVRSNWIIPVAADLGLKGVVSIAFEVDRNGNILNPRVISPSGTSSFDQAALNALRTSNPFPPLPADFPRPTLAAVFRFYYNTPVPQ